MSMVASAAPATAAVASATAGSVPAARNHTLDFVKGVLVLVMVLYHWLNYFVTVDWDVYRYLRFLTPSFILITGFVVSHVYARKYGYDNPKVRLRLMQRGLKLLLLFVVLNVATEAVGRSAEPATAASWAARTIDIFVRGDGRAAFVILVPIAYFLLLAPFALALSARTGITPAQIAGAGLVLTICAGLAGFSNSHIEFLAIALIGLAAGASDFDRVARFARKPWWLVLGYVLYLAAITAWNVVFPLQVFGVCLSVLIIYAIGDASGADGVVQRAIIALGQYSLFCYVVQIAALQVLRRGLRGVELTHTELLVPFVACLVVTVAAVHLANAGRGRWSVADSVYRTIFA